VPLDNNLLPHRLIHYLRECMKTCGVRMFFVGMIPLGEAPAATLGAVEDIFLPVVEMRKAVEAWVIPTSRQIANLTPSVLISGNS